MAVIVRWSDHALDHLESIRQFIAIDTEHYAALFVKQVFESAAILSDFPEIGTTIHETPELLLRERWIGKYRLVYRVSSELLEIVTIRHGARLFGIE